VAGPGCMRTWPRQRMHGTIGSSLSWRPRSRAADGKERQGPGTHRRRAASGEVVVDVGERRRTKGTPSISSFACGSFSRGSMLAAAPDMVDGGVLRWTWAVQRGWLGQVGRGQHSGRK
jgi:hypothetical protein